jgi:hypothetical protein
MIVIVSISNRLWISPSMKHDVDVDKDMFKCAEDNIQTRMSDDKQNPLLLHHTTWYGSKILHLYQTKLLFGLQLIKKMDRLCQWMAWFILKPAPAVVPSVPSQFILGAAASQNEILKVSAQKTPYLVLLNHFMSSIWVQYYVLLPAPAAAPSVPVQIMFCAFGWTKYKISCGTTNII